jgi:hypothetical protein
VFYEPFFSVVPLQDLWPCQGSHQPINLAWPIKERNTDGPGEHPGAVAWKTFPAGIPRNSRDFVFPDGVRNFIFPAEINILIFSVKKKLKKIKKQKNNNKKFRNSRNSRDPLFPAGVRNSFSPGI